MTASPQIAVLVSIGRHPATGAKRRAAADASAVEMALAAGCTFDVIHAGDADPALRDYVGMGVEQLTVLSSEPTEDVCHTLASYLSTRTYRLILTGTRAERGTGSGFLPYRLAHMLGCATIANIDSFDFADEVIGATQVMPYGQRRRVEARVPTLATVPRMALRARPVAFAAARRGAIHEIRTSRQSSVPPVPPTWQIVPAKRRPKRLMVPGAGMGRQAEQRLLAPQSATDAACAIQAFLKERGFLTRADE
jgi:electron transfer flavoprotein beta subunit